MSDPSPTRDDTFFGRLILGALVILVALGVVWAYVVNRPAIAGVTPPGQPGPILAVPTDRPAGIRPVGVAAQAVQPPMPQAGAPVPKAIPPAPKANIPPPAAAPPGANDPDAASAAANAGNQASQRQDWDTAIREFSRAIEMAPSGVYYSLRGDVYWRAGKLDDALADYDQAVTLDPANPDGYYGRGRVQRDRGDKAAAASDFQQFLDLKPDDDANAGIRQQAQQWLDELR